jgi:hypothetical protein
MVVVVSACDIAVVGIKLVGGSVLFGARSLLLFEGGIFLIVGERVGKFVGDKVGCGVKSILMMLL